MMRVAHARREEATPMRERKERKKKRRKKRKTILYTFVALCLHNFYAFETFKQRPREVSCSSQHQADHCTPLATPMWTLECQRCKECH